MLWEQRSFALYTLDPLISSHLSYATQERAHVALVVIRFVLSSHCYSGSQFLTAVSSPSLAVMTPLVRLKIL